VPARRLDAFQESAGRSVAQRGLPILQFTSQEIAPDIPASAAMPRDNVCWPTRARGRGGNRVKMRAMEQTIVFRPFIATMMLTLVVWAYMYARRLLFIFRSGLDPKQMTPSELARLSPPLVSNPSDNLKNLFEMPTVFYAVVLYVYATHQVDMVYVGAAWTFFVFRASHSAVHCTFNFIPMRFALYVLSAVALWFMVLRAAVAAFG
jgi:hypothetical protein